MKMKINQKIRALATSITGPLHEARNMPCQDCFRYTNKGKNFVAVVSDGAGSAKFGKIGARIICETIGDLLANADFANIRHAIINAIEVSRSKLLRHRFNKTKDEEGINDFAATLVGTVCLGKKGIFFHIGDGAALALDEHNPENFVASRPENGFFSCETYFYTMDDWKENLRFTAFENADAIFLMSDGVTSFAFSKDFRRIEKKFIYPIHEYLSKETQKARAIRALNNTLNTPDAKRLNNDDKTLFWAKL